jgi:hypothetical protein
MDRAVGHVLPLSLRHYKELAPGAQAQLEQTHRDQEVLLPPGRGLLKGTCPSKAAAVL